MTHSFFCFRCAASLSLLLGAGCQASVHAPDKPIVASTTGHLGDTHPGNAVSVAPDLAAACHLSLDDASRAPRFDVDASTLLPADRAILAQVARCFTTGPLRGHSLKLVGRADPRGEVEYNFALGEHRAGSAASYLVQLGVDKGLLLETSRGKLDATGTDEAGWQRDRRVDLTL